MLAFCFWQVLSLGQDIQYKQLTTEDNLSHDIVFRVFQHPDTGYIWFGTDIGLVRYNGHELKQLSEPENTKHSVLGLCGDPSGNLRIAHFNRGVGTLKPPYEDLITEHYSPLDRVIKMERFRNGFLILEVQSIALQFWTGEDQDKIDTLCIVPFWIRDFEVYDDAIYLASESGFYRWNGQLEVLSTQPVSWLDSDERGLYYADQHSIYLWKEESPELLETCPGKHNIDHFLRAADGALWVSEHTGGFYYHDENGWIDIGETLGDQDIVVHQFFEDHDHNIWAATLGAGVYQFTVSPSILREWEVPKASFYLKAGQLTERGQFIIGGDQGVFSCDDSSCYSLQLNQMTDKVYVYDLLSTNELTYISTNQGVYLHQNGSDSAHRIDLMAGCTFDSAANGNIYLAHDNSVYQVLGQALLLLFRVNENIIDIAINGEMLYLMTRETLCQYNITSGSMSMSCENSRLDRIVNDVAIDADGRFYCATNTGLYRFHDSRWEHIALNSNTEQPRCLALAIDQQNRIWVTTAKSVEVVDQKDRVETVLVSEIQKNEELEMLFFGNDGTLYLGSNARFFSLNDTSVRTVRHRPSLIITHLRTGKEFQNNVKPFEPITLNHNEARLNLSFDVIDLSLSRGMNVRYRLLPEMQEWKTTLDKELTFSNLSPGHYELKLEASHILGAQEASHYSLDIEVKPPWWSIPWVQGLLAFALASMIALAIWLAARFQRKRYQKRLEMETLKMKALNNQLNPHFLSNALQTMKDLLRSGSQDDALDYVNRFTYLLRKNFERLEENTISIDEEVQLLEAYLSIEQLRFEIPFRFSVSVSDEIPMETRIPLMVVQPFVENAVWHGISRLKDRAGEVHVCFELTEDRLRLRILIEDNGVGLFHSGKRSLLPKRRSGIKMTEHRLQLIDPGSKLHIASKSKKDESSGTRIELLIAFHSPAKHNTH